MVLVDEHRRVVDANAASCASSAVARASSSASGVGARRRRPARRPSASGATQLASRGSPARRRCCTPTAARSRSSGARRPRRSRAAAWSCSSRSAPRAGAALPPRRPARGPSQGAVRARARGRPAGRDGRQRPGDRRRAAITHDTVRTHVRNAMEQAGRPLARPPRRQGARQRVARGLRSPTAVWMRRRRSDHDGAAMLPDPWPSDGVESIQLLARLVRTHRRARHERRLRPARAFLLHGLADGVRAGPVTARPGALHPDG